MDPMLITDAVASFSTGVFSMVESLPIFIWLSVAFLLLAGILDRFLHL